MRGGRLKTVNSDSTRLADSELPAVEILLGAAARAPLEALMGPITDFRLRQVTWWPGRSITTRFQVRTSDGVSQVVACSGSIPDGAAILEAGDVRLGLWKLPNDPALPGLASVLDARTLRPMLASIGVTADRVTTRLRAYRPARRAVVQVDTGQTRMFIKVGRPRDVRRLHETHRSLSRALPVPMSLGYDGELGILVMPSGRGLTLRQALDGAGSLPSAALVASLVEDLPAPVDRDRTRSTIAKVGSLADLLMRVVPDQASSIDRLVAAIGEDDAQPSVPVHGDFHDGQVLVEDEEVTGLLDVDTHAIGHPADDPATMLGHLLSRRPHAPDPAKIDGFVEELASIWMPRFDGLPRRTAAVMLGLATGPFRVQQDGWPRLVADRIARAGELLGDESPLISVSGRSHARPST